MCRQPSGTFATRIISSSIRITSGIRISSRITTAAETGRRGSNGPRAQTRPGLKSRVRVPAKTRALSGTRGQAEVALRRVHRRRPGTLRLRCRTGRSVPAAAPVVPRHQSPGWRDR
jgi:hypothetical protein